MKPIRYAFWLARLAGFLCGVDAQIAAIAAELDLIERQGYKRIAMKYADSRY